MKLLAKPLVGLIVLGLFNGCSSSAQNTRPALVGTMNYAANYRAAPMAPESVANITVDWWQAFESPGLNQLLSMAQQQSPDLLLVAERVRQAELQMKIAQASLFPALNLTATTGERRSDAGGASATTSGSTSANLSVSYEVDLWGGVAASRRSAAAAFKATQFDQDAARLSIQAAIASSWFQWLALQERIATQQQNVAIAQRLSNLVQLRYDNGAASGADIAKQRTNLLSQQAALLPLQLQAQQTAAALAVLLGQSPQTFQLEAIAPEARLIAIKVPSVAPGTPADLVLRRPDLAAREQSLLAADADISQARAALLPGISLGAGVGRSSSELFSLNPATQVSNWSLSLAQTLFNGGRLKNQKQLSEARRAELLLQYQQAILTALQEVDMGLATATMTQHLELQQQDIVREAERALHLSEVRYREGSDDLLALLDAQRSLFQVQNDLVQQRLARLNAALDLYKALGGGWQLAAAEQSTNRK